MNESLPKRILYFLFASSALALLVVGLGALGDRIAPVARMIEHNREENIDPSALFYTESERVLHHSRKEQPND